VLKISGIHPKIPLMQAKMYGQGLPLPCAPLPYARPCPALALALALESRAVILKTRLRFIVKPSF